MSLLNPRHSFLLLALLGVATPAMATNGYFAHGYSASQRALGGAGTALPEDALVSTINPAATAFVARRWDANLSLFEPIRNYEAGATQGNGLGIFEVAPDNVRSGRELFGIPGFAWTTPIDDRSSAGLAVYGNGGMNTSYKGGQAAFFKGNVSLLSGLLPGGLPQPTQSTCLGTFGGGGVAPGGSDALGFCGKGTASTGVDLIQLFIAPNYAYKLTPDVSIGISPIIAAQRFEAKGLQAFAKFSNDPAHVSDQGYSFSYGGGARLGVFARVLPMVDVGASWQSRISMSRFKEYDGLFAQEGSFDIPSNWNVGIALKPTESQHLLLDYQRIYYSEVASVGNPLDPNRFVNQCALPRLTGSTAASSACLGADNGPGFGWQDMGIVKVGYQVRLGDIKLRAGYSKTHQPIPSSEVLFNMLAPGVMQQHFTAGANWMATPRLGLDLSMMYAPTQVVRGKNPLSSVSLGSGGNAVNAGVDANDQDIALKMRQYEVTLGASYRY